MELLDATVQYCNIKISPTNAHLKLIVFRRHVYRRYEFCYIFGIEYLSALKPYGLLVTQCIELEIMMEMSLGLQFRSK